METVELDRALMTLDPHACRILLDVAGEGYPTYASHSMRALCEAAFLLDDDNLARLGTGFPALAGAVAVWRNVPDGAKYVREAAAR